MTAGEFPDDFAHSYDRTPGENVAALARAAPADWTIRDVEQAAFRKIPGAGPSIVEAAIDAFVAPADARALYPAALFMGETDD